MKEIVDDSALSTLNSLLAAYTSLGLLNATGSFTGVTSPTLTSSHSIDISHSIDDPKVMMLLFARWITTNYGTPEYNVNGFDGNWWKTTLEHFIKNVYPKMVENGSVKATEEFLKN